MASGFLFGMFSKQRSLPVGNCYRDAVTSEFKIEAVCIVKVQCRFEIGEKLCGTNRRVEYESSKPHAPLV